MSLQKLPEGLKVEEKEGKGSLKALFSELDRYDFDGYLHILASDQYEGYIVLKNGNSKNAVMSTPSGKRKGNQALEEMKNLDERSDLKITVHTNLDMERLIQEVEGRIGGVEQVSKGEEDLSTQGLKGGSSTTSSKGLSKEFPERFSFDEFIVGPNNRFAYRAAYGVAKNPSNSYNPLFITSNSGLGKTHLLKAIGRHINENHAHLNVMFVGTSKFLSDLDKYTKEGEINEFRNKYTRCDVLLMDDLQLLAEGEKSRAQENLFDIFQSLQNKSGQIVLSSDRSPDELTSIEDRLISRFKSGLVVDILPPGYETRKDIIEWKAESVEKSIPQDVVDYIAKKVKKNVRLIEGALNRVIAYSSLLEEDISLTNVREALNEYIEDEVEEEGLKPDLKKGRSYIIEVEGASQGLELVSKTSDESETFIISRLNPTRVRNEFGLQNADIHWLTSKESETYQTMTPNLEQLSWKLDQVIRKHDIILLDGLEYLISNTSFDATLQFLRHTIDEVSETDTIFLVIVSPAALEKKQISLLKREMESISYTR